MQVLPEIPFGEKATKARIEFNSHSLRGGIMSWNSRIAYLAHPVGDGPDRAKNLVNVEKWFTSIFHADSDIAINIPWLVYVRNLTEIHRDRAMRDDLLILGTCGSIILTGGRISPGMKAELGTAQVKGLKILDLTDFGYEAPNLDDDATMARLADRLSYLLQ